MSPDLSPPQPAGPELPEHPDAPVAQPRAEAPLRRRHRRRRRPRPRHRLLPGQEPRHHQRRRAREGLARRAATWPATPRSSAPTTCGTRARRSTSTRSSCGRGSRRSSTTTILFSQRGRAQPGAQPAGRARQRAPGQRQPPQRRRRRVARPRTRSRRSARSSTSRPDVRYPVLGATLQPRGRHRQARPRGLGRSPARADALGVDLIQDCEVTGIASTAAGWPASQTTRGPIARRHGRARGGRAHLGAGRDGRAARCRSRAIRCRRWSPSCSSRCTRRVVMSNAVHVYVSQAHKGELVMGAGIDALQLLRASAARSTSSSARWPRRWSCSRSSRRAHVLRTWGGVVDVTPGRLADRRARPRSRACTSTAAGAPAGSRPRPASAGATRTRSPTASRIRSTRRSRSTASPPAR